MVAHFYMINILRVSEIYNMNEIKPRLIQKIESMFGEEKNKNMEIKEQNNKINEKKDENNIAEDEEKTEISKTEFKEDKSDTKNETIFGKLSEEFKQTLIKDYIFPENIIINIRNNYLKTFPNIEIYVDNELKYIQKKDIS